MAVVKIRMVGGALCALALSGCMHLGGTKKAEQPVASTYDQLMQKAESGLQANNLGIAKANFTKAAAADPTRKEPWLHLAQMDFSAQDYGAAIVDSQEVLHRDPSDVDAESLLTVAGLRVALQALSHLHDESNADGPAHQEAEKLAAKLRETLGEDVLSPPAKSPKTRQTSRRRTAHRAAPAAAPSKPSPAADETKPADSTNPFGALPSGH